jgi:hypothetical protein
MLNGRNSLAGSVHESPASPRRETPGEFFCLTFPPLLALENKKILSPKKVNAVQEKGVPDGRGFYVL